MPDPPYQELHWRSRDGLRLFARDYTAAGCQSPLTPFAPAGCVSATLSPWSGKSVTVKLNK